MGEKGSELFYMFKCQGVRGCSWIVTVEHPDVTGGLTLDYGADGTNGWDIFARVADQTWTNAVGTPNGS